MIKNIIKNLFLVVAIIILLYLAICAILLSLSIVVSICFVFSAVLLIGVYYVMSNPINSEEEEPVFIYEFINVTSIVFFSVMIFMIMFNLFYPKYKLPNDKTYDYIIVFGAGISEGKNEIMNSRLDEAIEYAKKYPKCKFVLTGAKGNDEPIAEAYYMRNYMGTRGISQDKCLIDAYSYNTYENIENSYELIMEDIKKRNAKENIITRPYKNSKDSYDLDFINIGFMSSEFHMTRINMMLKKKGIIRPYSIHCPTFPLYVPYMYVRENLSLYKAFVLGQLKL